MFSGVGAIDPQSASAGRVPRLQALEIATTNFKELPFHALR